MQLFNSKARKKLLYLTLLFLVFFVVNSCVELEEKITINPDLSGEYSLVLKGLGDLPSSESTPISFTTTLQQLKEATQQVKGITNVEEIKTKDQIGFRLKFSHAKDIKKLIAHFANITPIFTPAYFSASQHRFSKKDVTSIFLKTIEQDQNIMSLLAAMKDLPFGNFFYWTTIVTTPHPIKKIKKNGFVTLSADKKTATLKLSLDQIFKKTSSGFTLKY
jgi:hypothetical protein